MLTVQSPLRDAIRRKVLDTYRSRTMRSASLHARAVHRLPGGVTRSVLRYDPYPTYMTRGAVSRLFDADGNEYLDLMNNYSALIHGHAHPRIVEAIQSQVASGTDYGSPAEVQVALAEALIERVPSVEQLRFTPSGTEAVLYAIRVARAFTGKRRVLKFEGCYHGGYDDVLVSVDPGSGCPEWPEGVPADPAIDGTDTLVAPFNDLETTRAILEKHSSELAAVIVEPVMVRGVIPATERFLRGLRKTALAHDVLLILDEIVTLRLAPAGAQALYDVAPDITVLGKLIGGGLPLGAVGGRADVMTRFDPSHATPAHHSGTFAGSPAACAAGLVALELLTPGKIIQLRSLGDRLRRGLQTAFASLEVPAQVTGRGSLIGLHLTDQPVTDYRSGRSADREGMRWLHMALLNRGVFTRMTGAYFLSTELRESDIDRATEAVHDATEEIRPLLRSTLVARYGDSP